MTSDLVAYVDGGCLGNPGPSGIGVVISGLVDGPVRIAKWIGDQDNNVAEYVALMEALQYAVARKARSSPRLLRFSSSCAADDRRICVPQPTPLLSALDLPETGAVAEVFYLPCEPRIECRG